MVKIKVCEICKKEDVKYKRSVKGHFELTTLYCGSCKSIVPTGTKEYIRFVYERELGRKVEDAELIMMYGDKVNL